MSLFKFVKKGVRAIGGFATGGIGGAFAGWKGPPRQAPRMPPRMAARPGLPAVLKAPPRSLPGAGRVLGRVGTAVTVGGVAASLLGDDEQPRKRRRMNPCNPKALTRATRRMNAYMKQHKKVEQALRRACPPSVRRRVTKKPC